MMPKFVLVNLLKQGNTGDEILAILESLTTEEQNQPTLEEIKF